MKITGVEVHVMGIPTDDGKHPRRNWVFVRVLTDAGIVGVGEATTEWHEKAVEAQILHELRPRLVGLDPIDIEAIWQRNYRKYMWHGGVVQTSALSGIDMALWDIAGKAAGLPVFKMLGGKCRDRVRCYARADSELASLPAQVKAAVDEGFTAFKHGWGTPVQPFDERKQIEVALEEMHAIAEAAGPDVELMIDCAGIFTVPVAYRLIDRLRHLNMLFVEEPTDLDSIEPTCELRRQLPGIRFALGERLITRWACQPWFERRAMDICQADICHTGGISELMKIAHLAEVYGIGMAPHNPYGPIAMAACAHACAVMPNFVILEHCRLRPWFDRVQTLPVPIVRGAVDISPLAHRPGLGVELDWDLVRSMPYRRLEPREYFTDDGALWLPG